MNQAELYEYAKRQVAENRKKDSRKDSIKYMIIIIVLFVGFIAFMRYSSDHPYRNESVEAKNIRRQLCAEYQPGIPTHSEIMEGDSPELYCGGLE